MKPNMKLHVLSVSDSKEQNGSTNTRQQKNNMDLMSYNDICMINHLAMNIRHREAFYGM